MPPTHTVQDHTYEGQEGITLYRNMNFSPKTLGDFIDSYGLREYAVFSSADYYDFDNGYRLLNYYGFDDALIWDSLFADTDISSVNYLDLLPEQTVHKMTLVCEIQGILSFKVGFGISEKGYITTNLSGCSIVFYIGEEKAAQFIELITENYPYTAIGEDNDDALDKPDAPTIP